MRKVLGGLVVAFFLIGMFAASASAEQKSLEELISSGISFLVPATDFRSEEEGVAYIILENPLEVEVILPAPIKLVATDALREMFEINEYFVPTKLTLRSKAGMSAKRRAAGLGIVVIPIKVKPQEVHPAGYSLKYQVTVWSTRAVLMGNTGNEARDILVAPRVKAQLTFNIY